MADHERADEAQAQSDAASEPTECFHRGGPLATELAVHLPFSVSAVAIGLIFAGVLSVVTVPSAAGGSGHADAPSMHLLLFHLFHPAHMLFSAAATTAMFWRYDRRMGRAVVVGLTGAIVVCGISDIVLPALSAWILGKGFAWPWHICVIDHPGLVIPFAVVGIALGLTAAVGVQSSTFFSHSLHVFASTMASIFYLTNHYATPTEWIHDVGPVFILIILAVLVPCCLSDIAFPVLMSRSARKQYLTHGHVH